MIGCILREQIISKTREYQFFLRKNLRLVVVTYPSRERWSLYVGHI